MSSGGGGLSEEQKKRMEESRRKALERRALLNSQRQTSTRNVQTFSGTKGQTSNVARPFPSSNNSGPLHQGSSRQFSQAPKPSTLTQPRQGIKIQEKSYQPLRNFTDGSLVAQYGSASTSRTNLENKPKPAPSTTAGGIQNFFTGQTKQVTKSTVVSSSSSSKKDCSPVAGELPVCEKLLKGSCVLVNSSQFAVKIGFNAQLIALFKTISSRAYDAPTTTWSFGLEDYKALMAMIKDVPNVYVEPLPKHVLSMSMKSNPGKLKSLSADEMNLNCVDTKLVSALMPFQKEGVGFCIRQDGRAIIADEMGLGKTVQAICVAGYYRKEWPLLVVAPSSVRLTWQQAFIRWLPSIDPQYINVILTGKDSPTAGLINIISYDLLSKFINQLKEKRFRVIIADESHFIKNYKAARTKVFLPLLKSATRVILLSGTPALSRPEELYTQICAIKPKLFPSFHEFGKRYCGATENRWGWDYSGASNMEELQLVLEKDIMIRRLKKEVMQQLPSKRRQMVVLDPSLVKTKPLVRAAKQVEQAKKKDQHGALLNYFCETSGSKIAAVKNYVLDLLEGGHKFLIFAHHQNMLNAISECLDHKKYKYIRIDGKTASSKRQLLVDQFQQDASIVVAVLSITAANTGLTLTSGTTVVFAELFWNPGALVQAEDRVYRIGQKNSVNIHYLVAKGTADDYLWPLIQSKLEVLSKAGLSKDNFSEADTTTFLDPKQKTLFSCFESLIEEFDEPIPGSLASENNESETDCKESTNTAVPHEDYPQNETRVSVPNTTATSNLKGDELENIDADGFDWFDELSEEELAMDLEETGKNKNTCGSSDRSGSELKTKRLCKTSRSQEGGDGAPYDLQPSAKRSKM